MTNIENVKTIGIVGGRGKMGQLFKKAFEEKGFKVLISGRKSKLTHQELAKKSDMVIISVPIKNTIDIIREVAPHLRKKALLMDFTSVKKDPLNAMLKYSNCNVLGCHPLFGPSNGIKNQVIVLCPGRGNQWQKTVQNLFEKMGAIVELSSAEEHDKIMATVQGITHFISINFAHTLDKIGIKLEEFLKFQSPVYRVTLDFLGRILNQDPALYGSIQIENPETKNTVRLFQESGEEFLEIVNNKDHQKFTEFFNKGKKYLGDFTKKAQKESDELVDVINLKELSKREENFWLKQAKKADLALLGPKNTFTDLVGEKYYPEKTKIYCKTIAEVFEVIKDKKADIGLVPIENKIEGSVNQTLDELYENDIKICGILEKKIEHNFAILPEALEKEIKIIYSHSQALSQCRNFFKKNFPHAQLVPVSSTAEAVQRLLKTQDKKCGAVSSKAAAMDAGLEIAYENIGDITNNYTRFAVIKKTNNNFEFEFDKKGIISIAFFLQNKPGSLLKALEEFAKENVNMIKIHSRPTKKSFNEFYFFVDFEGNINDKKIKKVFERLKKNTKNLKILGEW